MRFLQTKRKTSKRETAAVAQVIQHTYFASSIPQNFESFPQVKIKQIKRLTSTTMYFKN